MVNNSDLYIRAKNYILENLDNNSDDDLIDDTILDIEDNGNHNTLENYDCVGNLDEAENYDCIENLDEAIQIDNDGILRTKNGTIIEREIKEQAEIINQEGLIDYIPEPTELSKRIANYFELISIKNPFPNILYKLKSDSLELPRPDLTFL